MTIQQWPAHERPREKLIQYGPEKLSNAELLAIFLGTGYKGKNAIVLAQELLAQHGSLHALLNINLQQINSIKGIGTAKFSLLKAALELTTRYLQEELATADIFKNSLQFSSFLLSKLRYRNQEIFSCMFLNAKYHLIEYEELFVGSIDCAPVYPREIVKRTLHHNAHSIVFAHNHPSGTPEPSQADIEMTDDLVAALKLINVKVLDHFIVASNKIYSFASRGLLSGVSE